MRLFKRICFTIIAVVFLVVGGSVLAFQAVFVPGPNHLQTSIEAGEIRMVWVATSEEPKNRYGALLVPVSIQGVDRVFHMQFDLGHPTTVFYEGKISAILERKRAAEANASPETAKPQDSKTRLSTVTQLEFEVGNVSVIAKKIDIRKGGTNTIDWEAPDSVELIGTIGSDFVEGKVIAMDYPKEKIRILSSDTNESIDEADWMPFFFRYRRTLLPAKVNDVATLLMYDTGSSAFDLITDSKTFEKLATPGSEVESISGNSWGKKISIQSRASQSAIQFGTTSLPLTRVTKMEGLGSTAEYLMSLSGMQGMTGNTLFLKNVLVLDYAKQRFGIR